MSTAPKMAPGEPCPIDPGKIPAEFRSLPRWVVWKMTTRKGKRTKMPMQARMGVGLEGKPRRFPADSTDPSTWSSFEEAMNAYLNPANGLDGIGFVFAEEGPYAGVDFDNCLDESGNVLEWARPFLDRLVGYAEVSPSGRGIKAFVRGEVPGGAGRKLQKLGPDKRGAIEVYDRGRYFTMTSRVIDDAHAAVGDGDGGAELAALHAEWFPPKSKARKPRAENVRPSKTDAQIIAKAQGAKNGAKFSALWNGSTDGYPSKSEADLGLCSLLAWWTGGDVDAVDRLFRQSGLCDEKWDRITYREPTIDKACDQGSYYDPNYRSVGRRYSVYPGDDQEHQTADEGQGGGQPETSDTADGDEGSSELPEIIVTTDEFLVNNQAIAALSADLDVFCRGNFLVTVQRDAASTKLITRPPETPRIAPLQKPSIRERISKNARWVKWKWDLQKKEFEKVTAHPPDWSTAAIEVRGHWEGMRPLEGVIEAPILRPDGSILDRPGYDALTGLLYEPNCKFPPIPSSISREDARRAAELLIDIVADFPFAVIRDEERGTDDGGAGHRAAFLAGLLTPLARYAIDGPCPLFLVDANVSASGKTKLCDIVAILATGRIAARSAYPESDDEMRKQILSIAIEGDRLMLLDNVATGAAFGGAALDGVLTGTTVKGRILGKSQMSREVPIYTVWYATGNNLGLKGDALRRVVPCRLESKEERPEERDDFKIPGDILKHVGQRRGELVVAAMTILRGYVLAGSSEAKLVPMDYPAWCRVVRQAIHWAVGIDPCVTRKELIADDPETNSIKGLISGWAELPGGTTGLTTALAVRILTDPDHKDQFTTIRDVLLESSRDGEIPSPRSIGMRLKKIKDKVVDGRCIKSSIYQGIQSWRVANPPSGGTGGTGGTIYNPRGKNQEDREDNREDKSFTSEEQNRSHQSHQSHEAPPESWRMTVAEWPDDWRERWGRVANDLAAEGFTHPADEIEAFARVSAEKDQTKGRTDPFKVKATNGSSFAGKAR